MEYESHFSQPFRMSSWSDMGSSNSREWDHPPPYTPYASTNPSTSNYAPYTPFTPNTTGSSTRSAQSPYTSAYSSYLPSLSSNSPSEFGFGIEIEAVVQPWMVRPGWLPSQYYERLAQALRNRDLPAKADPCTESYRKHPEHYSRWFITRDGSLATRPGCSKCMNPPSLWRLLMS